MGIAAKLTQISDAPSACHRLTPRRPTAPSASWMRNLPKRRDALWRAAVRRPSPLDRPPFRKQDASTRSTALPAELGDGDPVGRGRDIVGITVTPAQMPNSLPPGSSFPDPPRRRPHGCEIFRNGETVKGALLARRRRRASNYGITRITYELRNYGDACINAQFAAARLFLSRPTGITNYGITVTRA